MTATAALARPPAHRPPPRRRRQHTATVFASSTPPRRAALAGLFSLSLAALRPPIKRCESQGSGSLPFWTGLLGSPPCPEVEDVERPWRRRASDELPELPAPRRDVGPPAGPPRDAPAERDALDAERAARTQEFVESMWQTLE